MSTPDKRTVIAAAIYGLCKPITAPAKRGGEVAQPWSALAPAQQAPYIAVSEFLGGQMFGVAPEVADRPRLAATLEKAGFAVLKDVNANTTVAVFVNVYAALP